MRRFLTVICTMVLLLVVACKNSSEPSPIAVMTDSAQVIAKAEIDFDQNGEVEKLYVRMTKGELKEENEPGPYQGTYWEGEFRLELIAKDGTLLHALDLNPTFGGEPLIFAPNRDFTIAFEDYNGDGYPDFSIGQYLSSNGFSYNLYSLKPDGIAVIHRDLFTSDGRYSTLYDKVGNTSFKNRYYDMETGGDVETLFTWQGDRFVRTECEGCGMPEAGVADDVWGQLQLTVEKTEDGFRLAHTDRNEFYVAQTLVTPSIEDISYAVHIVRTTERDSQGFKFKRDAVIVNPETAQFNVYPLYDVVVDDIYNGDSVAEAYGFMDDRHLVYVSIVNDANRKEGFFYRVERLNVITGETEILFSEIPDVPKEDHFAPGWLNDAKNTLVLNSYSSGQLWSFDLLRREIIRPQAIISHSWPFFLTVKSPDGERFWYSDYMKKENRLYDKTGSLLSKIAFSKGYDQYPAFQWSSDSRYAAYHDTRMQNDDHIIGNNGEFDMIAPQRIQFFDRQGHSIRTVRTEEGSGKYIETAGWLDDADGIVVLHEYELDRSDEAKAAKINSHYQLLDVKTGQTNALQLESNIKGLKSPIPARTSLPSSSIYWVDIERRLLTLTSENGLWLSEPGEERVAWMSYGPDETTTVFHEFDLNSGRIREKEFNAVVNNIHPIGTEWLVWNDMNYMKLDWAKTEIKELEKIEETIMSNITDLNQDGKIGGWIMSVDYEQKKVVMYVKDIEVSKNRLQGIVNLDHIKFIEADITFIDQSYH